MAQEFATVDALMQQIVHVRLATEAQRVCRAGVEAMIAAGGKNIQASEFLGAYAMVLAHGVRVIVGVSGVTEAQALQAIIGSARTVLDAGLGPWTDAEGALR